MLIKQTQGRKRDHLTFSYLINLLLHILYQSILRQNFLSSLLRHYLHSLLIFHSFSRRDYLLPYCLLSSLSPWHGLLEDLFLFLASVSLVFCVASCVILSFFSCYSDSFSR